jgi:succinylglutamate desuccinylase
MMQSQISEEHVPRSKSMWDFSGREIGRVVADQPGPTLIAVAGIHGNERAGVGAARRVLATLTERRGRICGEVVAFAGNLGAMRVGVRYRARDMNRIWTEVHVRDLERRAEAGDNLDVEDVEQLELLAAIREAIKRARGQVFLIDLHTTSAHGLPFVLFGDTLPQRRFASAIPLPIVIGLEEQVDGVLSAYWTRQGCITCACEGGQHDDPGSRDNLEAVLLLGAECAGIFGSSVLTETATAHALLERRRGNLPRVMEVVSRRAIVPEDRFVMEPGFQNLARVHADQLLARDRNGEIRASRDGFVLLPLYQGQGDDGFFWGREASSARLRISEVLRHMKLDRFLHLLPGIRRDPVHRSRLLVDTRVARIYPLDVFHMLGYRRVRKHAGIMAVERHPD